VSRRTSIVEGCCEARGGEPSVAPYEERPAVVLHPGEKYKGCGGENGGRFSGSCVEQHQGVDFGAGDRDAARVASRSPGRCSPVDGGGVEGHVVERDAASCAPDLDSLIRGKCGGIGWREPLPRGAGPCSQEAHEQGKGSTGDHRRCIPVHLQRQVVAKTGRDLTTCAQAAKGAASTSLRCERTAADSKRPSEDRGRTYTGWRLSGGPSGGALRQLPAPLMQPPASGAAGPRRIPAGGRSSGCGARCRSAPGS